MVRKLYIKESNNDNSVIVALLGTATLNEYELGELIDWCEDYLSGYGLEAYVISAKNESRNKLRVFYEIENFEETSQEEVEDVIKQAVNDFIANA